MLSARLVQGNAAAIKSFDSRMLSIQQLVTLKDDVLTQSLFSAFRLLVIRDVDAMPSASMDPFMEILKSEPTGVCIVCLTSGIPASNPLMKFCKSKKCLIALAELQGEDLLRWIHKELKLQGVGRFDTEVPRLLASIGEQNPDRISGLIAQAALFASGDTLLGSELRALFKETTEASEYDFLDALMRKDRRRSHSLLEVILASGKSPFMLVGLLQRSFATYISIHGLLSQGKTASEIGQQLKVQPWLLKKHLAVVQNSSVEHLKRCMESLLRADSKLKNRSLGTESIFSEFVYNVTH